LIRHKGRKEFVENLNRSISDQVLLFAEGVVIDCPQLIAVDLLTESHRNWAQTVGSLVDGRIALGYKA
jgi:hypothetical protein